MSRWTDAPQYERCCKNITLRDGTKAQCGRRKLPSDQFCWQHARRRDQMRRYYASTSQSWRNNH